MTQFTTIAEVTAAVEAGHKVCWKNEGYEVSKSLWNEWFVTWQPWSRKPHSVGLFWNDGVTCDYSPEDFFIKD